MSLYLKYRPETFDQVKGNEEVIQVLKGFLNKTETCPHSFLLSGPTGCGKTTIARILAKELGCAGDDLRELNTANIRGIDTVREIIDNSAYQPLEGRCRVWIVDECHKLTNDAQNAFLKILEDTPKHVYFILCTTDPQKLLSAIKGRCHQLTVKTLSEIQIQGLIRKIAHHEGVKLEPEVAEQIVQDSLGHPRNAINIVEQVLNVEPERRLEIAKQTAAIQSQTIELCRALIKKSGWKEVRLILSGLMEQEPETIRRSLMGYAQAVLLKDENDRAGLILEELMRPTYDTGMPGITYACYVITKN